MVKTKMVETKTVEKKGQNKNVKTVKTRKFEICQPKTQKFENGKNAKI